MARRSFPSRARKIDFKQWFTIPGLLTEKSANAVFVGGSTAFALPATILRWRGHVAAMFDESMQAGDLMILTFALMIGSTDAFTLGSSAVPDPADEPDFPWVWWKQIRLDAFLAAGHGGGWGPPAQRYEVDSKAMRKMKPGESAGWVVQITSAAGAPVTLIDIGQMRILIGT